MLSHYVPQEGAYMSNKQLNQQEKEERRENLFHRIAFGFIAVALLLNAVLDWVNVPRPWSLGMAVIVIIGMVLFALDYPRVNKNFERNLEGSIDPIFQPNLYSMMSAVVVFNSVLSVFRSVGKWQTLTESSQMSTLISAIFGGLLLAVMVWTHYIRPRVKGPDK